jgi:hypothetical protein
VTERRHRVLVRVLFVVAVVTGLVAMFAVWANRQVLNTDHWTNTSSKLLANQNIRNALGAYLVDQLFTSVNVQQELQSILPPQAQALAGPAAGGLRTLADDRAPKLLARPRVQDAWRTANRTAHKEFLTLINGGGSTISTDKGEVVLHLNNLVGQLAGNLGIEQQVQAAQSKLKGGAGAKARSTAQQKLGVTIPASTGSLVIMKSDDLNTVQDVAQAVHHLAALFTALTLVLFAFAVWLARGWRREALRTTGWCFFGLGLFVLLGRRVVGNHVVDGLVSQASVKPAAHSAWDIGTTLLRDIGIAMLAYGVIIVIAAWLAGPTRSATGIRHALAPALRYRPVMSYGIVAFLFLLVILWGPTPATSKPLGIALFAGLLVLGMELLRRQTAREFPDVQRGESAEVVRGWFGGGRRGQAGPATDGQPAAGPPSVSARFEELDHLAALHDRGVLTDEEFASQKAAILGPS